MTILPFPATRTPEPRLTLPVAARANNRIRFLPMARVTGALLPGEAMSYLESLLEEGREIRRVTLEGPGDPLAEIEPTLETLELLQRLHPEMELSLTTLGLGAAGHAADLAARGVSEVTLLVDTVEAATAASLYAWIRPGRRTIPLPRSTPLLVSEQGEAVEALARQGIMVSIRTTVYGGINDDQVEAIARRMSKLGANSMTLTAYLPADEDPDGPGPLDPDRLDTILKRCKAFLDVRVSTGKTPSESLSDKDNPADNVFGATLPKPSGQRPNVAVVSGSGIEIDLHLGQADRILIYGPREDGLTCLLEARPVPATRKGSSSRWESLAEACLGDCFVLLAAHAGEAPKKVLAGLGIRVLTLEDNIDGTVDVLYGGGKKKQRYRQPA